MALNLHFTAPGTLRLYSTQELLNLKPPSWLVDGIIPEGGLAVLYAPPESFKSFVAIDLALCVATGLPWHGRSVEKGYSIYIAAEGGPGIGKRARAWLQHRGIKASKPDIAWLIESIAVQKGSADIERLMERLDSELDVVPTLVVIDTLAVCFEGNENDNEDMGKFVGAINHLRHEYGTAVLAVHHTRLDGDRERGATALRGGLDTMLAIERPNMLDDSITISCAKQKDAEHFADIELKRVSVEGTNSCVMVLEETDRKEVLLNILSGRSELKATEFQKLAGITGMARMTFFRALRDTVKSGEIIKENGLYSLS